MLSEPMTLYKLMILYMLRQVNFPLTEDRLSEFFLSREYTTYFTLKQALAELIDAELIRCHQVANTTRYTITPEGADTYQFFGKKITPEILKDMDEFLKENRFRIRSEVGVTSDYYLSDSGEMATGWRYLGGNWYYFNANGSMRTGCSSFRTPLARRLIFSLISYCSPRINLV